MSVGGVGFVRSNGTSLRVERLLFEADKRRIDGISRMGGWMVFLEWVGESLWIEGKAQASMGMEESWMERVGFKDIPQPRKITF